MAKYLTPDEYAVDTFGDLDSLHTQRVIAANGFRAGLRAARDINGYTVVCLLPISHRPVPVAEFVIVAWDPFGGFDHRGKAVSAYVRELPAKSWAHGEYFESPADEPFQRVQRAVRHALDRAGWDLMPDDES